MNYKVFAITGILTLSLFSTNSSYAGLFSSKKKASLPSDILNVPISEDIEQQQRVVLNNLATKMNQQLAEIQQKIDNQDANGAMALAKATLDDVKLKSGIDPKAKLRESFLVPFKIPQGASDFSQLNESDRNTLVNSIKNFRGGLYLDIVNLAKRTTLLYIKALHLTVKKDGGLLQEDRDKILRDLTIATIVPFFVKDETGSGMVVFEDDVSDNDHIYLFNREIKIYLLNSSDLGIKEDSFAKYRQDVKSKILQQVKELYKPESAIKLENAKQCMKRAKDAANYSVDENQATVSCFSKYSSELENYKDCEELANLVHDYSISKTTNKYSLRGGNIADAISGLLELKSPINVYSHEYSEWTQDGPKAKKWCIEKFK